MWIQGAECYPYTFSVGTGSEERVTKLQVESSADADSENNAVLAHIQEVCDSSLFYFSSVSTLRSFQKVIHLAGSRGCYME